MARASFELDVRPLTRALDGVMDPLRPWLENVAFELDKAVERRANPHPGMDKGVFDRQGRGNTIKHDIAPGAVPLHARAFTTSPIAAEVHEGRTAGQRMPPLRAIKRWLEKHESLTGIPPERAFYVARSMSRRGSKGVKFFDKGAADFEEKALADLVRDLERSIERAWDGR